MRGFNSKPSPRGGKVAPQRRMRGGLPATTHLRVVSAPSPLISQRAEPLTASPAGGSHFNERRLPHMKNILKKLALLMIPVLLWFAFFVAFEPNNYFGLKASASSSQPAGWR